MNINKNTIERIYKESELLTKEKITSTGVRQLQRHKTLPNRIAVEFFCQIF